MLALILFITFGLLFGYFATLNTSLVSVRFGTSSLENIPLYLLVLISLGTGVIFAALFYFLRSIPSWFAWGKKEKELTTAKKEINELTKKIHELELENTKLKPLNEQEQDEESL